MQDSLAIAILSSQEDDVQVINSTLRKAGHAAHCLWVTNSSSFDAALRDQALEATRPIMATKGRASFLGERSIGHLDPGARSSALLVHAVCDVIEERT